ncbi:putative SP-containing protein [Vairimorpha necatrix]|uniref:SP-containing protein n=1 Tax=Vairimorpha necatrix TaxID=6039 RepID=A0AAX4JBX6_9MICR
MKKIFYLLILVHSYRLLKPKLLENEDLYLTDINSKLSLEPFGTKDNQRISIHKRKIQFTGNKELTLDQDSLEIKLKKIKIVTYLKRPKNSMKKTDPFGFKMKKKNTETTKEEPRRIRPPKTVDRLPINNIKTKKTEIQRTIQKKVDIIEDEIPDETIKTEEKKSDTQNIDMENILSKVKHLLNEKKNYLIESDSKIEEDTIKYSNIEVFIHPISDKYIKLKTEEKDCVTYYKDTFIFTPCLNVDSQVFKLENEDDILKNRKIYEDDDSYVVQKHVKIDKTIKKDKSIGSLKKNLQKYKSSIYEKNDDEYEISNEDDYLDKPSNEISFKPNKKKSFSNISKSSFNYSTKDKGFDNYKSKTDKFDFNIPDYKSDSVRPHSSTFEKKYEPTKLNLSTPYDAFITNKNKSIEYKKSREYKPPVPVKPAEIKNPTSSSIQVKKSETDSSLMKLGSTDDFLQKIKSSVSMPEIDDLL